MRLVLLPLVFLATVTAAAAVIGDVAAFGLVVGAIYLRAGGAGPRSTPFFDGDRVYVGCVDSSAMESASSKEPRF